MTTSSQKTTPPKTFTSATALELIESLRGEGAKYGYHDLWIDHSVQVGNCASKLASLTGHLDPDYAKALGYIHDIGRGLGPAREHPVTGYRFLQERGYDEEICSVCLTHSFTDQNCEMLSGYRPYDPLLQQYIRNHNKTDYEELVTISDLYCILEPLPLEQRLIDILIRYGTSEHTADRLHSIYKLKTKIENLIGQSIEKAFDLPESNFKPKI